MRKNQFPHVAFHAIKFHCTRYFVVSVKQSERESRKNCRIEHFPIPFTFRLNYSLQLESKRLSQSCRNVDIVNWKAPKSRQQQNWSQHYSISLIEVPGNWFFTSIVSLSPSEVDSPSLAYMMMSLVHFPFSPILPSSPTRSEHNNHTRAVIDTWNDREMWKRAIRRQSRLHHRMSTSQRQCWRKINHSTTPNNLYRRHKSRLTRRLIKFILQCCDPKFTT